MLAFFLSPQAPKKIDAAYSMTKSGPKSSVMTRPASGMQSTTSSGQANDSPFSVPPAPPVSASAASPRTKKNQETPSTSQMRSSSEVSCVW